MGQGSGHIGNIPVRMGLGQGSQYKGNIKEMRGGVGKKNQVGKMGKPNRSSILLCELTHSPNRAALRACTLYMTLPQATGHIGFLPISK